MRNLLVCSLAVVWACAAVGCGEGGAGKTDTEKKFQELYKQYSARFYQETTNQVQSMPPMEVTKQASRLWEEVFSPNKALVTKRVDEILKELDQCPAIQEDQYNEVAVGSREAEAPPDKAWKTLVAGEQPQQDSVPDDAEHSLTHGHDGWAFYFRLSTATTSSPSASSRSSLCSTCWC